MKNKKNIALIVFLLTLLSVVIYQQVASAQTGYSYVSNIQIENTNETDWNNRLLIEINAAALVGGAYIQPDAEDLLVTQSGVEEEITALGLTENDPLWIVDYTTIPAKTSVTKLMYMGNASATRNQVWIASHKDTCYAYYDADFVFPGTSTFGLFCDITPKLTPSSGSQNYIVAMPGIYEMYIDGTPSYVFKVFENNGSSGTESITPNEVVANSCDVVGSMPGLLSDNNDATYIHEEHEESCTVRLTDTTLPLGLNVGTVTVRIRAKDVLAGTSWVQPDIKYDGGYWLEGTKIYPGTVTYSWFTQVFATDPEGRPWSVDRINELQLKMTLNGQTFCYVSEANILVEGQEPGSSTSISIPVTIDDTVMLQSYYINGNIGISDGVNTATDTASTNLHQNTSNIHFCEYDGYADNVKVAKP